MLLREVQGEVLALQREQQGASAGSQGQQQHQPSTLALASPPGSVSGSSTRSPGSLLQLRSASSSLFDEREGDNSGHRASAGVIDARRRETSSEDPNSAGEGSGTAPRGSGTVLKGSEPTDAASKSHGAVSGPSLSSSSLALLGWEIANDDDGNEFYFNGTTGESRWDPPTMPDDGDAGAWPTSSKGDEERVLAGAGERDSDCGAEAAGGAERALLEDSALKPPDALPAGWEAVALEDGDGGVYYHHVASGLTQWEVPHEGDGDGERR